MFGTTIETVQMQQTPETIDGDSIGHCLFGGGGTHLLNASVIRPLTTHPFPDRATFLLLIEKPPTFRRSSRFFHT